MDRDTADSEILLNPIEDSQKAVENREWMRGAAGYEQIDRHDRSRSTMLLWMIDIRPAANGARSNSNDNFRSRHGLISLLEGEFHVVGNGPRHKQPIGVARGRDVLNPEPANVPANRRQHIRIGLTRTAATGADDSKLE